MLGTARILLIDNIDDAKREIDKIGCDHEGTTIMAPKAIHRVIKINNVSIPASHILKEEMLSIGGEAARAKGVLDNSVGSTDVLLMGTLKQFRRLNKKLRAQPFGMKKLADELNQTLVNFDSTAEKKISWEKGSLTFGKKTLVMGIVNITPDSFSGDGLSENILLAIKQIEGFIECGVDIIDIGGESTRPGSLPVEPNEEIARVSPIIKEVKSMCDIPISIDSYKPEVVSDAINVGATIINDITGLQNAKIRGIVSDSHLPAIMMHMQGTPFNMQEQPFYEDVIYEIIKFFRERISLAIESGIAEDKIIIDPGIGFGKTVQHNLEIIKRLSEFKSLGCPILIGSSRKSFIGKILDKDVDERLFGTAATVSLAINNGADIVRVHDVEEISQVVKMSDAVVRGGRGCPE